MESDILAQSLSLPWQTCASNADKCLAQILFESGLIQRWHTKVQKAEDDQHLKEAKASKEKVVWEGLDQLELMKVIVKAKMAEVQLKKLDPPFCLCPCPCPCPWLIQNSRKGKGKQKDAKDDRVEGKMNEAMQVSTHSTPTMWQPHPKLIKGGSFGYWTQLLSLHCKDLADTVNWAKREKGTWCKYLLELLLCHSLTFSDRRYVDCLVLNWITQLFLQPANLLKGVLKNYRENLGE